jgi:exodeoxyribonuclease VII small subunit
VAKKKVSKQKSRSDPQIQGFEESLAELEKIVSQLESGKLGLSEALTQYEAGVGYLKACHGQLEQAERRIELLSGVDTDGNPIVEPFNDGATSTETTGNRSQQRTAGRHLGPAGEKAADVDSAGRLF